MSIVHNMIGGGASSKCLLTVKNCGANATVSAVSPSAALSAVADSNGVAVFTLRKKDIYTISSTISKGTTEFLFYTQTEAELWLHTLPNEYQEVEYLESTGTQYIKTGILYNVNHSVEGKFMLLSTSTQNIFGIGDAEVYFESGNAKGRWATGLSNIASSANIDHKFTISHTTFSVDDTSVELTGSSSPSNIEYYIFARNNAGSPANRSSERIYYLKIFNGNVSVLDLVPCYRISDSVAGMYDIVNDVFYTNSGTGTFTVGQDILYPDDFQEVEYLQSSGSQYINTLLNSINGYRFEIDCEILNSGNYLTILGAQNSNGANGAFMGWKASGSTFGLSINNTHYTVPNPTLNTLHHISFSTITTNRFIKLDDEQTLQISNTSTITNRDLYLFGLNDNGSFGYGINIKAKNLIVYDYQNDLVYSFIPIFRKRDHKAGMWDSVSKKFFVNAGTGEFIVGRMKF